MLKKYCVPKLAHRGGFWALLLIWPMQAWANNPSVHEYRLDNGLKILVKEDHRVPVVVSQVWYKIGSSYEVAGRTGLSHLLEHMMFKGTEQHGAGEFSRIMAENGAEENAFTSTDYTTYYQKMEKSRLEISFKLEADRMRHLKLDPAEFAKEKQVVIEERRLRTDDKPNALAYELFQATAYQISPYRNPTIGWPADLENSQLADLQTWYQQWYAPNNAILVVAGDVEAEAVLALAKRYFGPLQASTVTLPRDQTEMPQRGIKRVLLKQPAKLPYLLMGYQVPVLKTAQVTWEPYALQVLSYVLDGGDSARFTRDLIRGQEIATSISTSYDPLSRLEERLLIAAIPSQGHDVAALETALRTQLQALQTTLVTQAELDRVKAQLVAAKVFEQDSVFYQAMQLGQLEAVGLDWRLLDGYVERLTAVTPEQIQQVARRYLQDDGLTVAVLEPLPLADGASATSGEIDNDKEPH